MAFDSYGAKIETKRYPRPQSSAAQRTTKILLGRKQSTVTIEELSEKINSFKTRYEIGAPQIENAQP